MTDLVVETGTGLTTATSYVDVAFADEYLGSDWATDTESKEAALIAASEYLDVRWGSRFQGSTLTHTQALLFPRSSVRDARGALVSGIPNDLKKAVALYARESTTGTLYPAAASTAREAASEEYRVGPVTTKVSYTSGSTRAAYNDFSLADGLVRQYLSARGGGTIRN